MLMALENPPTPADPFFWADFVELRAIVHPDKCFSRGDLTGLLRRSRDTNTARQDTHDQAHWQDLINYAGVRITDFGQAYPFSISNDRDTLQFLGDDSPEQKSYLRLLLSSLMRHVPSTRRGELARFFEQVSESVFARMMPSGTEVRSTWAHGGSYKGTLFEKMQQVAKDIRCRPNFEEQDFKPSDSGDGGIDLIAWHPMSDERDYIPIAFAQCGCSKEEWRFKMLEASPAKHGSRLPVGHPWATYYFLPLDLRRPDGDWAYKSDFGQAIVVDRLRLMRLAAQNDLHTSWPALPLMEEIMQETYT